MFFIFENSEEATFNFSQNSVLIGSFSTSKTEINDVFIEEANHICIAISMYNFTEYSDNYLDTSGNLWQFNRDELLVNNDDLAIINSQSFKY